MIPSGIGFGELVVIAIVLLLVVGPKKLPDVAKDVGKGLKAIRRVTSQLRDSAEVDEIKRAVYGEGGHAPVWKRSVTEHLTDLVEGTDENPGPYKAVTQAMAEARAPYMPTPAALPEPAGSIGPELEPHDEDGRPIPRPSGPAAALLAAQAAAPTQVRLTETLPSASSSTETTNGESNA